MMASNNSHSSNCCIAAHAEDNNAEAATNENSDEILQSLLQSYPFCQGLEALLNDDNGDSNVVNVYAEFIEQSRQRIALSRLPELQQFGSTFQVPYYISNTNSNLHSTTNNISNVTNNNHAGNTTAAVTVYDNFTHPPPSASESIPESFIQEALTSTLFANVKGLTIGSILDAVKSTISDSNVQLPNDDVTCQYIKDELDENKEHIEVFGSPTDPKYTLSNTYRVFSALEELAAAKGSSADEIVEEVRRSVTIGRVNKNPIIKELYEGTKDGRYVIDNNLYKIQPLYGLSNEEKNEIKDTKQTVEKQFSVSDNDSSEPKKKKRKTKKAKEKKISQLDITRERKWNDMLDKLKEYESKHGDCNVPAKYDAIPKLADWVTNQRREYKNVDHGYLKNNNRMQKLKAIGFTFDLLGDNWNDMFDKLKVYKAEHGGDTDVPKNYSLHKLGQWVHRQRREYKKVNHGSLKINDRMQRLQAIGFVFNHNEAWNDMFDKLTAYKTEHGGDTNVPRRYSSDAKFGNWVHTQRREYKKENHGQLTDERIQKLQSIGFIFDLLGDNWNDMFDKLKVYKGEHGGDTNVPQGYNPDPKLGTWVMNQRLQYKKENHGQLTDERINRLDEIGFDWVWKSPSYKWVVSVLKKFYELHGHCHVPYPTSTNSQTLKKVWPFVSRLRKRVRQGKTIPEWLVDELTPLGFELDPQSYRARRKRAETKILHDLEVNHNIKWNAWDEKIENTDSRPDAFIVWKYEGKFYIIFKEIDEHRHDDRSIVYEQTRMTMLTVLAKSLGFESIYFVRTNSAERKEIDQVQQEGVAKLLKSIMDEPQDGVHVRYVDFPFNHHHYLASVARWIDEDEDEVDLATGEEGEHHMLPLFNSVEKVDTGCSAGV